MCFRILIMFSALGLFASAETPFKTVGPHGADFPTVPSDNPSRKIIHIQPGAYFGRPWRDSPSVTFICCSLCAGIRPEGWSEWNVEAPLVRFAEYACHGLGAGIGGRVAWAKNSSDPAPVEFSLGMVPGDWKP